MENILRLVTPVLPSNANTLQATNLPLSGTIQPFQPSSASSSSPSSPATPPVHANRIARCSSCDAYLNPTCKMLGSRSFCCGVCGATSSFSEALPVEYEDDDLLKRYFINASRFRKSTSINRDLPVRERGR